MACLAGLEPATNSLEGYCSIQLSYKHLESYFWFIVDTILWTVVRERTIRLVRPILYSHIQFWPTLLNKLLKINKLLDIKNTSLASKKLNPTLVLCSIVEVIKEVLVELLEAFLHVTDPGVIVLFLFHYSLYSRLK